MGSPKFLKMLVMLAIVGAAVWGGLKYLKENPNPRGIERIQQEPLRPPSVPNPLGP